MYCYKSIFVTNGIKGDNSKWYRYYNRLLPINAFGGVFSDEDAKDLELKVVPAWIESKGDGHGNMLFLNCGEMVARIVGRFLRMAVLLRMGAVIVFRE